MMSNQEFRGQWTHIHDEFDGRQESNKARRDQEIARLFNECGWTQEQIAEEISEITGKSIKQNTISQRLTFGRFLTFIASGDKSLDSLKQLTERRFREYWLGTKGKGSERDRFDLVALTLEHGIPHGKQNLALKPGICAAVAKVLEDGKKYTADNITASLEEEMPGATVDQVERAIQGVRKNPPKGFRLETEKHGKRARYKLVENRSLTPIDLLHERVGPLLDELDGIGKMHEARMSPVVIGIIANKLRKALEALMEELTEAGTTEVMV